MTWEQIQNQQGLYIPGKPNINGISIFNACDSGDGYVETIKPVSVCAEYIDVYADQDEKYELNPRTRKSCVRWKKEPKRVAATKSVCANWVYELDEDYDEKLVCEKGDNGAPVMVDVPVSMTRSVAVYRDVDADGPKTYVDDSDTLAFNKDFTLPMCEEVVEPVPGKKK